MPRYQGHFIGFKFDFIAANKADAKIWLKSKIKKYVFYLEIDGVRFTDVAELRELLNEILAGT